MNNKVQNNHIDIVTCESGDWVVVYINGDIEHEGHSLGISNWIDLIEKYKFFSGVSKYEVSDEYMEQGLPDKFRDISKSELH